MLVAKLEKITVIDDDIYKLVTKIQDKVKYEGVSEIVLRYKNGDLLTVACVEDRKVVIR